VGKKNKNSELPLPFEPSNIFKTSLYFSGLLIEAHQQLNETKRQVHELKLLRAIALSQDSSPDEKRDAVREADTILKRKRGGRKLLSDGAVRWLTEMYDEWIKFLATIQKLYDDFTRKQGMSKQEALDALTRNPRIDSDFFSNQELAHIVTTSHREYILEALSRLSGFAVSTLDRRIRRKDLQ